MGRRTDAMTSTVRINYCCQFCFLLTAPVVLLFFIRWNYDREMFLLVATSDVTSLSTTVRVFASSDHTTAATIGEPLWITSCRLKLKFSIRLVVQHPSENTYSTVSAVIFASFIVWPRGQCFDLCLYVCFSMICSCTLVLNLWLNFHRIWDQEFKTEQELITFYNWSTTHSGYHMFTSELCMKYRHTAILWISV